MEHVGVPGRYGIEVGDENGDIDVMNRFAEILKPGGLLIMTVPCGRDAIMTPWCRVYGLQRLPDLLASFVVSKEEYWIKNSKNQWTRSVREDALNFITERSVRSARMRLRARLFRSTEAYQQ